MRWVVGMERGAVAELPRFVYHSGDMFELPETQKAYEFCYATFRVAALVRKPDLKERLERQAGALLEKAAGGSMVRIASGEFESFEAILETLRALIMLSEGIGEIRYVNAKVLLRELGNLERMVKEGVIIKERGEEFDVEKMFSTIATGKARVEDTIRRVQEQRRVQNEQAAIEDKQAMPVNSANDTAIRQQADSAGSPQVSEKSDVDVLPDRKNTVSAGWNVQSTNSAVNNARQETRQNGSGNGEARASAIYTRTKLGNVSIKELVAELGNVSERTLRYDLQRLVEQGRIERVGSGGPGTYYRIPQASSTSSPQAAGTESLLGVYATPLISETAFH
ncbi:MAG: DeoR family transcriptional regulator [bacterium]|nr:DeoR family transcriptional regulator [bacterium]